MLSKKDYYMVQQKEQNYIEELEIHDNGKVVTMEDDEDEGNTEKPNPYLTKYKRFDPYLKMSIMEDCSNFGNIYKLIYYMSRNIE